MLNLILKDLRNDFDTLSKSTFTNFKPTKDKKGYSLTTLNDIVVKPESLKISYEDTDSFFGFGKEKMLNISYEEKKENSCYASSIKLTLPSDADPETLEANITDDGVVVTVKKKDSI